jgi:hypothetical protein
MSKRSTKAVDAAPAIRTSKSKRKVPNLVETMLGAQGLTSAFAADVFTNAAARSGWGTNSLAQGASYELVRFSYDYWSLITLYRNHWVSRKIVDIPAQDCVKAWPKLTSDIEPKDLTKLDRALRKTNTKNNILTAITWARLFGGAGALMIIDGQGDQLDEPLDLDSVGIGSFKGVLPFDRWTGLTPVGDVCTDITRPLDFNKPEMYEVRTKGGGSFKVHSSRLLRFLGPSVPAPEDGAQSYWGISVLEPIYEAITKVDNASFNILNLTFRANLLGIEFPQLEQILSGVGGTQEANKRLEQRLSAVNAMMSSQSLILLPKDGKLEATSYTFSGLAEVYQLFQLELSGGSGIPVTRLWGRTYSGLGGTANEGDEKVYDEKIASDQATYVLPQLEKMYPVICMSELGEVPADLDLVCPSIRVLDEKEKSELAKSVADTLTVYMNGGIMSPRVVGKEVKQSSGLTGVGTNLTNEDIEKLSDKVQAEGEMGEGLFGKGGLNAASDPAKALKEEDKAGKEKLQEVPEDEDEDMVAPVGTAPAMDSLPTGLKPGSKVDVNGKQLTVRKVTTGTHDLFGEPTVQVAFTTGEVVAYAVPDEEKAEDADSASTSHSDMMLYHALPVRIETPKGGTRSGPGWTHTLPADYGFIDMGINGADGDSIDAYVGPDPESSNVYVIDQYKLDGKSWDEHKVMLAYPTQEAAVADYMAGHHKSDRVFAAVTAFTMPHFRKWLSQHDMSQPCDPSVEVRPWA